MTKDREDFTCKNTSPCCECSICHCWCNNINTGKCAVRYYSVLSFHPIVFMTTIAWEQALIVVENRVCFDKGNYCLNTKMYKWGWITHADIELEAFHINFQKICFCYSGLSCVYSCVFVKAPVTLQTSYFLRMYCRLLMHWLSKCSFIVLVVIQSRF